MSKLGERKHECIEEFKSPPFEVERNALPSCPSLGRDIPDWLIIALGDGEIIVQVSESLPDTPKTDPHMHVPGDRPSYQRPNQEE